MDIISARRTLIVILIASAGAFWNCGTTRPDSRLQGAADSLGLQMAQLRLNNVQRAARISLLIDAAADSILRESNDRKVSRNAHQWRIFAVPVFRQSLFFSDPGAATLDAWTCSVQMRQFFTVGSGNSFFGDQQAIAVRTAQKIESIFKDYGDDAQQVARFENLEARLEEWASSHPIEGSLYDRTSIIPYLKEFQVDIDQGVVGSVQEIAVDVRALSTHLNLFAAQIPREARWHGEYLLAEMDAEARLDEIEADAARVTDALGRVMAQIESGELAIDIKALRSLHSDILRLEQRIGEERALVLDEVSRQRIETLARIDALVERSLAEASSSATDLVDHLVWRAIQLLAA
jgi:hypothetical protein